MSAAFVPTPSLDCGKCMSRELAVIDPNSPLLEAARLMRELGVGALPVCQGAATLPRMLGMVTDRDIVVRVIAEDLDLERVRVGEVMSSPVIYCYADESPWTALHLMEQHLIRRLPVVDRETRRIVGILSISDLSRIEPGPFEGQGAPAGMDGGAALGTTDWSARVVQVMGSHRGWSELR